MEIKENKSEIVQRVVDIICDCCGNSCKKSEHITGNFEYMKMATTWGYDSNKDLEQWIAHICESCVDEKFTFIKFQKFRYPGMKEIN
jgi:hypothetical protein